MRCAEQRRGVTHADLPTSLTSFRVRSGHMIELLVTCENVQSRARRVHASLRPVRGFTLGTPNQVAHVP